MNIFKLIGKVGKIALNIAAPGVLQAVNEVLPSDKRLPENATGEDLSRVVKHLPDELLNREFEVIKEEHDTLRTALEADISNPHTTRPRIALGSFKVIAFVTIMVSSIWGYGVVSKDAALVLAVTGSWQFILAITGPLVTLLWAYFGILKKEHQNRMSAASGVNLTGTIGTVLGRVLK